MPRLLREVRHVAVAIEQRRSLRRVSWMLVAGMLSVALLATGTLYSVQAADHYEGTTDPIKDALSGCGVITFDIGADQFRTASTTDSRTVSAGPFTAPYANSAGKQFRWEATGGNPNGHLRADDLDGQWQEVWTPVFSDPDFSILVNQEMQFDYKNDTGYSQYRLYVSVKGKNGQEYYFYFNNQLSGRNTWNRVKVPMKASSFYRDFQAGQSPSMQPSSPPPTEQQFSAVMSNLDHIAISVEGVSGPDTSRFDNFGRACDFGDAPESTTSFRTTGVDAARHNIAGDVYLGNTVDSEIDGIPSVNADGDDLSFSDDEDSVSSWPLLPTSPSNYSITVAAHNSSAKVGTLYGWIDFNGNGIFEPSEASTVSVPANSGNTTVTLTWPSVTATGSARYSTYARLRFTTFPLTDTNGTQADERAQGIVSDGEVEDYNIRALDFGDAPDSYGTTNSANGASQLLSDGLRLGAAIDAELNGLPTAGANGDDLDRLDDEDGLSTISNIPTNAASFALANIPVTNNTSSPATLYAWIDFNRNGHFDAAERTSISVPSSGTYSLNWASLSGLAAGGSYLRLRLSPQSGLTSLGFGGIGEVEDYPLSIVDTGTIIIRKQTAPSGGTGFSFTGDLGAFTLDDTQTKVFPNLTAGTYQLTEASASGYELSGLQCDDANSATASSADLGSRTATIRLDPNETVTCSFTNAQLDAVILEKLTVPPGGTDFQFDDNLPGNTGSYLLSHNEQKDFTSVPQGSYSITETNPNPYYDITGISCRVGNTTVLGDPATGSVDFALNNPGVTSLCTFTNTQRSTLVIVKETLPDGDPQAFGFSASGPDGTSPVIPDLHDGSTFMISNAKSGAWTVSETVPGGWTLSEVKCKSSRGSTYTRDLANAQVAVDLLPGDYMQCRFTNAKEQQVTINKVSVPAGGTGFAFVKPDTALDDGGSFTKIVAPGEPYTVIEGDPTAHGYALTDISCEDNVGGSSYSISLAKRRVDFTGQPGLVASCTYTNTALGAIIIEKSTQPAASQRFGFNSDISDTNIFSLGNGESQQFGSVVPGSYQVVESSPGGDYLLAGINCDDGGSATPSWVDVDARTANINVDPGETVKCTFSNQQKDTVVIQTYTRPAGDTATAFEFSSNLPNAASFNLVDGALRLVTGAMPGQTYTVVEAPTAGYDLVDITCYDSTTGQAFQGDLASGTASFTPSAGHTIYCSFVNQARGKIVIEKEAEPAGGVVFEYTNTIDPANPLFSLTGDGGQSQVFNDVKPGQYTVQELADDPEWRLARISCTDSIGNGVDSTTNLPNRQATVNLDAGETVTCRFLNVAGDVMIVEKFTDPPGDTTTDFDFLLTETAGTSLGFTLKDQEFEIIGVEGGLPLTIAEEGTGVGYDLVDLACLDVESGVPIAGQVASRSIEFTTEPARLYYCAFVNRARGSVSIAKETTPSSGDSFSFTLTGAGGPYTRNVSGGSQTTVDDLVPGTYVLSEADPLPSGYSLADIECLDGDTSGTLSSVNIISGTATVRLDPGENVSCTFANQRTGRILIDKITSPSGSAQSFDFTLQGPSVGQAFSLGDATPPYDSGQLVAGAYSVLESRIDGWTLSSAVCDNGMQPNAIDLQPGATVTCTFTNTHEPTALEEIDQPKQKILLPSIHNSR